MRKSLLDRFWEKVQRSESDEECWQWLGALTTSGYGHKWNGERVVGAHRWAYEHFVGPIGDGLSLDHLCRNRSCVNPGHLEPVTNLENTRRGIAGQVNGARQSAITHCPQGHEYSPQNTYWRPGGERRMCRKCMYERNRERRARLARSA